MIITKDFQLSNIECIFKKRYNHYYCKLFCLLNHKRTILLLTILIKRVVQKKVTTLLNNAFQI